jgi:hypothetical protein
MIIERRNLRVPVGGGEGEGAMCAGGSACRCAGTDPEASTADDPAARVL